MKRRHARSRFAHQFERELLTQLGRWQLGVRGGRLYGALSGCCRTVLTCESGGRSTQSSPDAAYCPLPILRVARIYDDSSRCFHARKGPGRRRARGYRGSRCHLRAAATEVLDARGSVHAEEYREHRQA